MSPLPDTLPDPVPDRAITVDCWQVVPHVIRGSRSTESTSVLMLHAPDGWRGAIVLTQYSGTKFAFGQLERTVPYLARLLSPGKSTTAYLDQLTGLAAAGWPMLRDAMMDPAGWDPTGEQYADIVSCDEYGEMNRYILGWASCGVTGSDAALLEDHQLRPLDGPESFRKDLRRWHAAGWTDAHDVAMWLEAGCATPAAANRMSGYGLSAQEAYDWESTPVHPSKDPAITRAFIDAGWTPVGVRHLATYVNAFHDPWTTFYSHVYQWARAMPPAEASAYLSAGWTFEEAVDACNREEAPDETTLAFLAAWKEDPRWQWRLEPSQMGVFRAADMNPDRN